MGARWLLQRCRWEGWDSGGYCRGEGGRGGSQAATAEVQVGSDRRSEAKETRNEYVLGTFHYYCVCMHACVGVGVHACTCSTITFTWNIPSRKEWGLVRLRK